MSKQQMTMMFCPINLVGPMNALVAIANVFKESGHKVVFAIKSDWTGKLKNFGFIEEIIGQKAEFEGKGSAESNANTFSYLFGPESGLNKMIMYNTLVIDQYIKDIKEDEPYLEEIVRRVQPDVILIDHLFWIPSLMDSGIPWVWAMTTNPLLFDWAFNDDTVPPSGLGLPTSSDPKAWKLIRKSLDQAMHTRWVTKYNNWIISKGSQPLPKDKMIRMSPYLNIYNFPKELDYTDIRSYPPKTYRFDGWKRPDINDENNNNNDELEIPEQFLDRNRKLIYLSMGSMGSGNVQLMMRLVNILSESEHKFIVSKGPFGDQYELPDNMWGQNFLPQLKILPIVDLVITHGGNNTLTETLFYGKLILVMPLFLDQFDNAQRLVERGLSIALNPFECTETELIESIDKLLTDKLLEQKMAAIFKRIQTEKSVLKLPQLFQNLVQKIA